ncbi:hypothetical protein D1872_296410 [compost metagenome]
MIESDIASNRCIEDRRVLRQIRNMAIIAVQVYIIDIDAVEQELAFFLFQQTDDQFDHGGFSPSAQTNERHGSS